MYSVEFYDQNNECTLNERYETICEAKCKILEEIEDWCSQLDEPIQVNAVMLDGYRQIRYTICGVNGLCLGYYLYTNEE